jgi:hypothetical protein
VAASDHLNRWDQGPINYSLLLGKGKASVLLQQIWVHFVLTRILETKELCPLWPSIEHQAPLCANTAPPREAWATYATHKIFLTFYRHLGLLLYVSVEKYTVWCTDWISNRLPASIHITGLSVYTLIIQYSVVSHNRPKVLTLVFLTLHTCIWGEKFGCSDKLGNVNMYGIL